MSENNITLSVDLICKVTVAELSLYSFTHYVNAYVGFTMDKYCSHI